MREIKFRVWDGDQMTTKVMDREMTLQNIIRFGNHLYAKRDTVVFMQSTGLLDKHGKEVYESDIVKTKARDEARQVVWNIQRGCYYLHPLGEAKQSEVDVDEFNTATSMMPHWFTKGFYDTHEEDCAVEVIGNIHESPELLEKDKGIV